jgi:HK97 family phage major capsid protein
MAATPGQVIDRPGMMYPAPDASKSGLIPIAYSSQIIESAIHQSMALSTFRRVTMPTGITHLPVLDVLPVAKWVTGEPTDADTSKGKKAATDMKWKGLVLTAEEVAAIVVIPEAVLEDSSIDLWAEVSPRLAEAIGIALDLAVFPGTDKPASWPTAIIPAAVAAGNVTVAAAPDQDDYNAAFGQVEGDGYMVNAIYAKVDQMSNFRGWNAGGVPIYVSDLRDDGRVDSVYGVNILFDRAGVLGTTKAVLGDPSNAILGVRRDIEYKFLSEATIDVSAAQDGSALVYLAQQDSVALRVRARFAYQVANPVNRLNPNAAQRFPFAVINPA